MSCQVGKGQNYQEKLDDDSTGITMAQSAVEDTWIFGLKYFKTQLWGFHPKQKPVIFDTFPSFCPSLQEGGLVSVLWAQSSHCTSYWAFTFSGVPFTTVLLMSQILISYSSLFQAGWTDLWHPSTKYP